MNRRAQGKPAVVDPREDRGGSWSRGPALSGDDKQVNDVRLAAGVSNRKEPTPFWKGNRKEPTYVETRPIRPAKVLMSARACWRCSRPRVNQLLRRDQERPGLLRELIMWQSDPQAAAMFEAVAKRNAADVKRRAAPTSARRIVASSASMNMRIARLQVWSILRGRAGDDAGCRTATWHSGRCVERRRALASDCCGCLAEGEWLRRAGSWASGGGASMTTSTGCVAAAASASQRHDRVDGSSPSCRQRRSAPTVDGVSVQVVHRRESGAEPGDVDRRIEATRC